MASRSIHRLTDRAIQAAKSPGNYADGGDLYLQVAQGVDQDTNKTGCADLGFHALRAYATAWRPLRNGLPPGHRDLDEDLGLRPTTFRERAEFTPSSFFV
jgi:hypothetical protein